MENGRTGKSRDIQSLVFGVILVLLFLLVCRLLAPFFTILLWSILIYIILKPLYQKCINPISAATFKGKLCHKIISVGFALGSIIFILLPLFFVCVQLFRQLTDTIVFLREWLVTYSQNEQNIFDDISQFIRDFTSDLVIIEANEIRARLTAVLSSGLEKINFFRFSGNVLRNVGLFFAGLLFMLFTLYFFFMDGSYLSKLAQRIIPIRKDYIAAVVGKFKEISRQLILGYVLIALVEATMAFVVFSIFRIHASLVFAALIFFSAFIPLFGPAIIYTPLGILTILNGYTGRGILLILVSACFISTIENFVRPVMLRDRIKLHPLIIFFAILGGMVVFGANGLILGPMVIIIFLTVLDLFLREHKFEKEIKRRDP
jgi:predicted PurR-regulated permease PerM